MRQDEIEMEMEMEIEMEMERVSQGEDIWDGMESGQAFSSSG